MPSDANGVYSLPAGYLATTGETIQASQHNPPLEDLASSMSARLMRSGAAPMTGPLKATDGSSGSPAVQFANAPSTGFYKTTNGIGISVGGALVAEFGAGGLSKGGKFIGELFSWTGTTAPSLCVFPYGQVLLRASYPDLWAFAQTEIAAGSSFYNNGNGTTTFGIGDFRGRVMACNDSLGGTPANRITLANLGTTPSFIGSIGGGETHTLTPAQMPTHFHTAGISDPGHAHSGGVISTASYNSPGGATIVVQAVNLGSTGTSFTGVRVNSSNGLDTTNSAGSGTAHNNIQPTMICNFVLFAGA